MKIKKVSLSAKTKTEIINSKLTTLYYILRIKVYYTHTHCKTTIFKREDKLNYVLKEKQVNGGNMEFKSKIYIF